MRDKLRTLETKRARRAKHYAPRFDIRALEAELREENRFAGGNPFHGRMDSGRMATTERNS